mgnify:CR=1 FL=1
MFRHQWKRSFLIACAAALLATAPAYAGAVGPGVTPITGSGQVGPGVSGRYGITPTITTTNPSPIRWCSLRTNTPTARW